MSARCCAASLGRRATCGVSTGRWRCCWRPAPAICWRRVLILPRRGGQQLLEGALEVRLIGKAAFAGGRGDRQAALQQPMAVLHAAIDQIGVRRHAVALAESADQVRRGKRGGAANVVQRQRRVQCASINAAAASSRVCASVSGWRTSPSPSCRALKYSTMAICFSSAQHSGSVSSA